MSNKIGIDLGYGNCKISYQGKEAKFPTAICFATDVATSFGDENDFEFEGEKYLVGQDAVGSESFTTTDYKFLYKYGPLLIYYILNKFDEHNKEQPIDVYTGLSISDWSEKDSFLERITSFQVNGEDIEINANIMPQGAGIFNDFIYNYNDETVPDRTCIIDIGTNTINFLNFVDGKPVKKDIKSFVGHGVTSILKPFTTYLENTYKVQFSETEALQIFVKNKFKYNGEEQQNVIDKITELKSQFVRKLFSSVLTSEKKVMAMADVVIIAGGGSLLLKDIDFPPNITIIEDPVYSNVKGFLK